MRRTMGYQIYMTLKVSGLWMFAIWMKFCAFSQGLKPELSGIHRLNTAVWKGKETETVSRCWLALQPRSSLNLLNSLPQGFSVFGCILTSSCAKECDGILSHSIFPILSWIFLLFPCCGLFVAGLSLVYDVHSEYMTRPL